MSQDTDFGFALHSLGSAIEYVTKLAASDPKQARRCAAWVARLSDELGELAGKLQMQDAAE